jgi:hypothetical protein
VRDAKILAEEFFPEFSIADFVSLPRGGIYVRMAVDGVVPRGFSWETLGPDKRESL